MVTQSFPREDDPDDYWVDSFAGYVLFMERDESYTIPDDYEMRHGRWLEVFERSRLMDHLSSYTFADDLFPGPLTHYCVCGCHHVVDVVTTATPWVRLLTADEVAALDWELGEDEEEWGDAFAVASTPAFSSASHSFHRGAAPPYGL